MARSRSPLSTLWRASTALAFLSLTASAGAQTKLYVTSPSDDGSYFNGIVYGAYLDGVAGDFRWCWNEAMRQGSASARTTPTIIVRADVTLTQPLPPWKPNYPVDFTITSDGFRNLSGGNGRRLFFFDAENSVIRITQLGLINGTARGGTGRDGGGGGAGLGGALFVAAGAVELGNVEFSGNQAIGGSVTRQNSGLKGGGGGLGGDGGSTWGNGSGGGGGYYGAGGSATSGRGGGGGGGVWTAGASPSDQGGGGGGRSPAGGGSVRYAGAAGGSGGDTDNSFVNGLAAVGYGGGGGGGGLGGPSFNDGGSGGAGLPHGGGGGGANPGPYSSEGGTGGNGGDYGGGGGGSSYNHGNGGAGGYGGGGGSGGPYSQGGPGGFGGGQGLPWQGWADAQAGSGFGGSVFARAGGSVTLLGGTLGTGTVTSGGTGGAAEGDGAYLHSSLLYLRPNVSLLQTIAGTIAGSGSIIMDGPAESIVILTGANTFVGNFAINSGTVRLSGAGTSGGAGTVLQLGGAGTLDLYGVQRSYPVSAFQGSGRITNSSSSAPSALTLDVPSGSSSTLGLLLANTSTFGLLELRKTGAGSLSLTRSNTHESTVVQGGTLALDGGDNNTGIGCIRGSLTIENGAVVNANTLNAIGYATGRKIDVLNIPQGTFKNASGNDMGWGVSYLLKNAVLSSNGGVASPTAPSKFAFGGKDTPTTVRVLNSGSSEILGRIDLRPDFGRTMVDFHVEAAGQLRVPAVITSAAGAVGLRKLGSGGFLILQAPNTYAGGTVVSAGVLQLEGTLPQGVGTVRGAVTVESFAELRASVTDAFGYYEGQRVTSITVQPNGLVRAVANAGNQGWGVAYTLHDGALLISNDGVTSTTANSKFAFGGPTGAPTRVNVVDGANPAIEGRVDLRADSGNPVTIFTVANGGRLTVNAALTSSGGAAGFRKQGPGVMYLRAANTYTGPTEVAEGTLRVAVGATLGTGPVTVSPGAQIIYDTARPGPGGAADPSVARAFAGPLVVRGTLRGADVLAGGLTVAASGVVTGEGPGTTTLRGAVSNHGILRFTAGAVLAAGGAEAFVNHGVLDLLHAGPGTSLPPNFVNAPGAWLLTPESVRIASVERRGQAVQLEIDGWHGHTYQLQCATSMAGPFRDLGPVQAGAGWTSPVRLFLRDAAPAAEARFYRVVVR